MTSTTMDQLLESSTPSTMLTRDQCYKTFFLTTYEYVK